MDAAELLTQNNVDKTQLPPLHQKRILAFVNHFLITSCSFLNEFSLQCESKFIELERKLQKVEASLTILEAKLASIPDPDVENKKKDKSPLEEKEPAALKDPNNEETKTESSNVTAVIEIPISNGIPASEHSLYKKFFKMLQVGVPAPAVQLKMQSEGVDPNILNNPQALITLEVENES